jgi:hypothetical protein
MQLVAQGDYSTTVNCQTEIPVILRQIFGILRGILNSVSIYPTISRCSTDHWLGNTEISAGNNTVFSDVTPSSFVEI